MKYKILFGFLSLTDRTLHCVVALWGAFGDLKVKVDERWV